MINLVISFTAGFLSAIVICLILAKQIVTRELKARGLQ